MKKVNKLFTYDVKSKKEIMSVRHNVRLTKSSIHIISDNAERITGNAMSETTVFV